jgi:hypothetical protein
MQRSCLLLLLFCGIASGAAAETELGGHTKLRLVGQSFPSDSLFRSIAGGDSIDLQSDLRLDVAANRGRWSATAAYQMIALYGDSVEWTREPGLSSALTGARLPGDERRLWDLTDTLRDGGKTAVVQRLDRLAIGYAGSKTVLRLGRQALSWGNGLFYAPMDLVNPFDPAAIDTEFKPGDDMLYAQYLRDNGDDVQIAQVFRRDAVTGSATADVGTSTLKYHGFAGSTEFDLLVAESYGDTVIGLGGVQSVGGAIWRADLVASRDNQETTIQFVTNLTYSWVWRDRNMSGAIEYYFNGFGQRDKNYDPASLAANPALVERIARRELFALGRHYLAGSVTIEMSPLFTLTPTMLGNIGDPSALLQLVTQYSLGDNLTFLGSVNFPLGGSGSEFGGIDSGLPGTYFSTGASLFAQIAWYF